MKITILTATYNSSQAISNCISSIFNQTFTDIEHIIIDGSSLDNTIDCINSMPNRIKFLISEPDSGVYGALNKGIHIATGDIIGFVHSDDMLATPQTLENIVRAFSSPTVETGAIPDVVYGDLVFVDQQDINKIVRYWKSKSFKPDLLNTGWMPAHPTVFMHRKVYEKHGFYNVNLKCASDYDYMLRVFRDESLTFCYIPEIITKMRRGGISNGGIKSLINKWKEDYWVLRNNKMPYPLWVLFVKNVSKIPQLIFLKH